MTFADNNPTNVPKYPSIREFLSVSEKYSDSPALYAPGRPFCTYRDLAEQIHWVVSFLNSQGIGGKDPIAVLLPNGPEMAGAFLSVMAGAVCAPLNPNYQFSEYEFYLTDLKAKALILQADSDSPAREVAVKLGIPVLHLVSPAGGKAGCFRLELTGSGGNAVGTQAGGLAGPEDTALVLHTSGTTSRPKMVPLSQTNVFTSAHNVGVSLQLTQADRSLNVMPLFHIHGLIASLTASLSAGGSVVCTPGFEPDAFFHWMEEFKPTWYTAVPTIHQAVLREAEKTAGWSLSAGSMSLRFIRSCSSALAPQVMAAMDRRFGVPVVEAYGMTEAAHQISCNPLTAGRQKPGSVGIAAGPEAAIMDADGNFIDCGETGEIVIRGANVTCGYLNNPEANDAGFAAGWFHTGDQGRMDEEGYIYLTGRLKELINQGGEKISPREIDEALLDHEAVHQAVAFGVPHQRLGEAVAAAVVFNVGKHASEAELKSFVSKRLADFKVPRQIVFTDQIPKGPTGKLQRIGLHEKLAPLLQVGFIPAATETEFKLASLWGEVLGISDVGRFDNFFMRGGDSILATQLVMRINKDFATDLPLSQLFLYPSPADLGFVMDERMQQEVRQEGMGIKSSADDAAFKQLLAEVEDLADEDVLKFLDE